ncbi:MAG TPA: hypothetical protein PLD73_00360 [Candidatus Hydrogenedentes bacterium]|nr:hypothetical protein [Candidatus Hydrogenedentota bacterium]HPJ97954.1 hypothetical protein [Candidatus Hydrogenedentota bacterium]
MSGFTTETMVRLRFQLQNTASVPAELIEAAIDDAHAELLTRLKPGFTEAPLPHLVVTGETLLAGAEVYRALAAQDAHSQVHVAVGGQRVEAGRRFDALMAVARSARTAAWDLLAPFLRDHPPHAPADVTDTIPILGGSD